LVTCLKRSGKSNKLLELRELWGWLKAVSRSPMVAVRTQP
jgi:hypothetical protein